MAQCDGRPTREFREDGGLEDVNRPGSGGDPDLRGKVEAGFSVLVVFEGDGQLRNAVGDTVKAERGAMTVVPFAWVPTSFEGDIDVIVAKPPLA